MDGNGNGNGRGTATRDDDFSSAIAQSILEGMQQTGRRDLTRPTAGPTWVTFAAALDKAVAANPALERALEEVAARSARSALASRDLAVPSVEDFLAALRTRVTARGGTVVRAFWWGFHIQISHEDMMQFLATADPVNALIGAIGGGIPSPASPFIAAAAAFVAAGLGLLRGLDRGNGVYISMSWFAPFIFVPTSV